LLFEFDSELPRQGDINLPAGVVPPWHKQKEATKHYICLSGAELEGADLTGASLPGVNLADADLRRANLSGANLEGANLSGAYLEGADLTNAVFSGANLTGANFDFYTAKAWASSELMNLFKQLQEN